MVYIIHESNMKKRTKVPGPCKTQAMRVTQIDTDIALTIKGNNLSIATSKRNMHRRVKYCIGIYGITKKVHNLDHNSYLDGIRFYINRHIPIALE